MLTLHVRILPYTLWNIITPDYGVENAVFPRRLCAVHLFPIPVVKFQLAPKLSVYTLNYIS